MASATVHMAEVGTTFVSGISHWRFGNVSWRLVVLLGVPGAVGAYTGASVLTSIDGDSAKPWIAGLLLALGIVVLARFTFGRTPTPAPESRLRARSMTPLGLVAGFIDAIGGGGWGPVTTPTLLTFGRVEPRKAIGSVSASEFLVSLAASIGFLAGLGDEGVDAGIVAALLVGGIIVAPFAAYLVKHLPIRVTGTLVGSLVIVTNTRTLMTTNDVAGPTRLVVLIALVASAAALVRLAVRSSRAELAETPPAAVAPAAL